MKAFSFISAQKAFLAAAAAFACVICCGADAQAQFGRGLFTPSAPPEAPAPNPTVEAAPHSAPQPSAPKRMAAPRKKTAPAPASPVNDANDGIDARFIERQIKKNYQKTNRKQALSSPKFLDLLATGAIQVGAPAAPEPPQDGQKKDHAENASTTNATPPNETAAADLNAIAKQYCGAIAQTASDARIAWQEKHIHELEEELNKRADELNVRMEEFRALIAKHDDALQKADDNVVAIYAKMKPESAALQLAAMEEGAAAAILTKLNARGAGAILNEMPPDKAAHLTSIMSLRKAPEPERKKAS